MNHSDLPSRRGALMGLSALALLPLARAQAPAQTGAAERPRPASAQGGAGAPPRRGNQVPAEVIVDERVESFPLNSPGHSGPPWQIHLARPRGQAPEAGCPVLYLLDGNAAFPAAWHALAALRRQRSELAEALDSLALVGIGYPSGLRIDTPRRYHDFTPHTAEEYRRARGTDLATGGREVFLDFVARSLRQAIAARLPVDLQRQSLCGHSLGGLFTMHVLFNRPELFRNYIAGDPSFWWNGASVMQEQAAFIAGVRAAGGQLASPLGLLVEHSGRVREEPAAPAAGDAPERAAADPGQRPAAPDPALGQIGHLQMWHRRLEDASHGSMLGPLVADAVLFALGQIPAHAQMVRLS
ncbi:alpha/beta hydrolase [Corticibacter populi]|nr:alpha/beta hydrolase-fold protein [Corticibacter populi]